MLMTWTAEGDRALVMELAGGGADWIEARAHGKASPPSGWGVQARLGGTHYKLGEVFASQEAAQGGALLLAMRLLPLHHQDALHSALDDLPGAWWWKITRDRDESGSQSIVSSRLAESEAAAERSGRAAGGGWSLTVYGPGGSVRECGLVGG